jgi:hypothetical protein
MPKTTAELAMLIEIDFFLIFPETPQRVGTRVITLAEWVRNVLAPGGCLVLLHLCRVTDKTLQAWGGY